MKPEGLLLRLQMPTTFPCPHPDQSSPCRSIPLPVDPSEYYPLIYDWVFQVVSFLQVSPPNPCMQFPSPPPVRATCSTHLILLDFITWTICGEEYRSLTLILLMWRIWWAPNNASKWQMGFNSAFKGLSTSLSSFLHCPVTSTLLGPNICSTPYSQTPSAYIPPSVWATNFHIRTKQQVKL